MRINSNNAACRRRTLLLNAVATLTALLLTATTTTNNNNNNNNGIFVSAFPSGAGACPRGVPAVMGPHLSQPEIVRGQLSEAGLTLSIGGIVVPPGAVLNFVQGDSYDIGIQLADDADPATTIFRGLLMRLEDTSGQGMIDIEPTDDLTQNANVCDLEMMSGQVVGLTHTSNIEKTEAFGNMVYTPTVAGEQDVMGLTLDVTVVVQLRNGVSEYYYSSYTINFLALIPTPAPSRNPATPPSVYPPFILVTSFPSEMPSDMPGTRAPVVPTGAPILPTQTGGPLPTPPTIPPIPALPTDAPVVVSPTIPPIPALPTDAPVPTIPPVPALPTSPPMSAPPTGGGGESCLYTECMADSDCCPEAPDCRRRNIGGGLSMVCSAAARAERSRISDGLTSTRPPRGVPGASEAAPEEEEGNRQADKRPNA
mmetsp:Transcript_39274/g.94951  ORF Transcript_39274/g.94951 Transcript_39274/m.94951 type:complete len:424 (+) Transcript_39274:89-1360(+)